MICLVHVRALVHQRPQYIYHSTLRRLKDDITRTIVTALHQIPRECLRRLDFAVADLSVELVHQLIRRSIDVVHDQQHRVTFLPRRGATID